MDFSLSVALFGSLIFLFLDNLRGQYANYSVPYGPVPYPSPQYGPIPYQPPFGGPQPYQPPNYGPVQHQSPYARGPYMNYTAPQPLPYGPVPYSPPYARSPYANFSVPYQPGPNPYQPYGNRQCGFPIVLPEYPITPSRMHGKWYGYLVLRPELVSINSLSIYLGRAPRVLLPLASGKIVMAEVQDNLFFSYNNFSSPCDAGYYYGWQADTGQYLFLGYDVGDKYQSLFYGTYIYDDYDNVEIFGQCDIADQNFQTGYCSKPNVYVNTRVRPDEMPPQLRHYVDQTVSRVMEKYCLSRKDFTEQIWTKNLTICSEPPPRCYLRGALGLDLDTGFITEESIKSDNFTHHVHSQTHYYGLETEN